MYRCQVCKQVVPPHTKAVRVPVETRTRKYPDRRKEISRGRKKKTITIRGGTGTEIVREVVACPSCAAKLRRKKREAAATASV